MGKHRQPEAPDGYKGKHRPDGPRDRERQLRDTGHFVGSEERRLKGDRGEGDWLTTR